MLKTSLAAASLAVMVLSSAYAADDLCTDAHMKQMDAVSYTHLTLPTTPYV